MLANISIKAILGILFFSLSNANIQFNGKKLIQRLYTIAEALSTTRKIEIINKKDFAKIALDNHFETFLVHIAALKALKMTIHLLQAALIIFLQPNKALTEIFSKYLDDDNVFLANFAIELPKHNNMNNHIIKLVKNKHLFYKLIHILGPTESKNLTIYIKIHLKTGFNQLSKSPTRAFILIH